jgi:hypothetical protein
MLSKNILVILISLPLLILTNSCKKENTETSQTPEQLLTANTWKPSELRAVEGNTAYYYKRGTTSDPKYNLDNESILFNLDKTGSYTGTDGKTYPFTWTFTNDSKTNLTWTVHFTSTTTTNIYWEISTQKTGLIRYDEYYTNNGLNIITFGERIPK